MKKKVVAIILACVLVVSITTAASAATGAKTLEVWYKNISIMLDGEKIELKDSNGKTGDPFVVDGVTYVPLRALAETLGLMVDWKSTGSGNEISISSKTDTVVESVTANCKSEAYGKAIHSFTFKVNSTASILDLTADDFELCDAVYDGMEIHDVFSAKATKVYFTADTMTVEVEPFYPGQSFTRESYWKLVCTDETFSVDPATELIESDPLKDKFVTTTVNDAEGNWVIKYHLYTPEGDGKNMPLVFYNVGGTGAIPSGDLYGSGANFLMSFAKKDVQAYMPGYVMCVERNNNNNDEASEALHDVIQSMIDEGKVDADRVYITGESAGGRFTEYFVTRYPGFCAAAVFFNPMLAGSANDDGVFEVVDENWKTLAESGTKVMFVESLGDDTSAYPERVSPAYNALVKYGMEPGADVIWHYYTAATFNALCGDRTFWPYVQDAVEVTDPITGTTTYTYPDSKLHNSSYPAAHDSYIKMWLKDQSRAGFTATPNDSYSNQWKTRHPEEGEDYSVIPDRYTRWADLDDVPFVVAGNHVIAYTDDAGEYFYLQFTNRFEGTTCYVEAIVLGGVGHVVMDTSGGWFLQDINGTVLPDLVARPASTWQPYAG